jgi:ABC-2 type transport system ATP-binding protein
MTTVIRIEGLHKSFRAGWRRSPVQALSNVSMNVEQGEVFGFIGPNGAGKSTTIKILLGLIRPTDGRVELLGRPVDDPESRRGLGCVFENPSFPDQLTPLEILRMGCKVNAVAVDDTDAHCLQWLERFSLSAAARRSVKGFSKGMVQRTALAHALALRPRLLILDEPLSGLDPIGRRDVIDVLVDYRRQGGTIFLTSHVLHDIERLADRFGLIHQGQLRAVSTPSELAGGDDLLTIRSMGTVPVAGMVEETNGRWTVELPRNEVWVMLEALRTAGHVLIEVKPTLSLESAFMRAIGRT